MEDNKIKQLSQETKENLKSVNKLSAALRSNLLRRKTTQKKKVKKAFGKLSESG